MLFSTPKWLNGIFVLSLVLVSSCSQSRTVVTAIPGFVSTSTVTPVSSESTKTIKTVQTLTVSTSTPPSTPISTATPISLRTSVTPLPKMLLLYTDGRSLYSYPERSVLEHFEINTLYESVNSLESFLIHLSDFSPSLSPSGDALLILGMQEEGKTWLLNLKQKTLQPLFDKPVHAVWDPQGIRIAYSINTRVYVQYISQSVGKAISVFQEEPGLGWLSWSPDGNWIAGAQWTGEGGPSAYDYNIWLVPPEGEESHLLNKLPLPATELTTESVFQWSPDTKFIWINGNYYSTSEGTPVSEEELLQMEWVFCNTQSRPFVCVLRAGLDKPDGYERLDLEWVFCQQSFQHWSHDCKQRAVFEGSRLYINNLVSGQIRQITEIDGQIGEVHWSPDDNYLIFSSQPVEVGEPQHLQADIFAFSLETGELFLLPVKGVLVDVIPFS